jgi:hypothetical protein
MSCVVVVSPLVIAGWPFITAAVTAAVGAMGFSVAQSAVGSANAEISLKQRLPTHSKVDIEVEDSEILEDAVANDQVVVTRPDGIRAIFSRDERGALKLCMEGESVSKGELKRVGEELIQRVTQQFVYHRVVTELKQRNMTIVDESVSADRTVKIRVRNI